MKIADRYAGATRSSNLKAHRESEFDPDAKQGFEDVDVLGAYGLADKHLTEGKRSTGPDQWEPVKPSPLSVPLERLFTGDNRAAAEIVRMLSDMAFNRSWPMRVKINRVQCDDMAKACLAWHRDGTCKPCGGHGMTLIPGTPAMSGHECQPCKGTGRIKFEPQFRPEHRELARWLEAEMTRATGRAGTEAMKTIAPTLNL